MKRFLPRFALSLALASLPLGFAPRVSAQVTANAVTLNDGYIDFNFDGNFAVYMYYRGVGLSCNPSLVTEGGSLLYKITGGYLDKTTGAGEVGSEGGFIVTYGNTVTQFRRFAIDTTGPLPTITAVVIRNGVNEGREPVFVALDANAYTLPLGIGVYNSPSVPVALTAYQRQQMDKTAGTGLPAGAIVAYFAIRTTLNQDYGPL